MARRSQAPPKQPANLTPEQMRAAIPKLQRRIDELEAFDPESVDDRSDPGIKVLGSNIVRMLASVFGPGTIEYDELRGIAYLDRASINMMDPTPIYEVREGFARGRAEAIALLQSVIAGFEEELGDLGESDAGRALRAIEGLDLHPEIEKAAGKLYRDGHYGEAVRNACMALSNLVQNASGRYELDGTDLMQNVFSVKNSILRFNDMRDDTDRSEQQGMMFLYAGAMLAFRNPRSHKFVEYDAEKAVQTIAFISLLAKFLDEAETA